MPNTHQQPNKGGLKKGAKLVTNDGVRKIQALAMMRELALGKTVGQVAEQFNTSKTVVRARLSYAQRAGLFVHHEDVILSQMVPHAQNVLMGVLDPNVMLDPELKVKVALEVFKGTGLLRKPGTAAPAALQGANKKSQATLEEYINSLRTGETITEGDAVDAEYTERSQFREPLALTGPAGTEPAGAQQVSSPVVDAAHGEVTETAREGVSAVDEAAGNSDTERVSVVSGEAESGSGEARRQNRFPPGRPTRNEAHIGGIFGTGEATDEGFV
jgi:hypothetical protein